VLFRLLPKLIQWPLIKRHEQGWVDEIISDLDELTERVIKAKSNKEVVSIAYDGNIVDVWEKFEKEIFLLNWVQIKHHIIFVELN